MRLATLLILCLPLAGQDAPQEPVKVTAEQQIDLLRKQLAAANAALERLRVWNSYLESLLPDNQAAVAAKAKLEAQCKAPLNEANQCSQ